VDRRLAWWAYQSPEIPSVMASANMRQNANLSATRHNPMLAYLVGRTVTRNVTWQSELFILAGEFARK
jgi:hypothetical protein